MADRLTEDEMVEILEGIARESGNAAARIAAIKTLREMRDGVEPAEEGFAALYAVPKPDRKAA